MSAPKALAPAMFSVFDDKICLGHIIARGKLYEAFHKDDRSLGTFGTVKQAANELLIREGA